MINTPSKMLCLQQLFFHGLQFYIRCEAIKEERSKSNIDRGSSIKLLRSWNVKKLICHEINYLFMAWNDLEIITRRKDWETLLGIYIMNSPFSDMIVCVSLYIMYNIISINIYFILINNSITHVF